MNRIIAAAASFFSALGIACAAVDANTASRSELESISGIGPATSARIVEERRRQPFRDAQDLMRRVKGIGEAKIRKMVAGGLTVGSTVGGSVGGSVGSKAGSSLGSSVVGSAGSSVVGSGVVITAGGTDAGDRRGTAEAGIRIDRIPRAERPKAGAPPASGPGPAMGGPGDARPR